jgi:tRNA-modifying protein YgfZ
MTQALFKQLPDRALIRIEGADSTHFLQNIVTCDVTRLLEGQSAFGALLTPQGKILFDFFLVRTQDGFLIDAPAMLSGDLQKRLAFYRLRAKVAIEQADPEISVFAIWGGDPGPVAGMLASDPRLAAMGHRLYGRSAPTLPEGDYHAHRIAVAMPQGGADFAYGDTFPHEALMDQFGGVDFSKGCYVGQEVVSRMQHRGTARTRLVQVQAAQELPPAGTEITAGEKSIGKMGSSSGMNGLAIIRLDRAKAAIESGAAIRSGGIELLPSIQEWARFGWPGVSETD